MLFNIPTSFNSPQEIKTFIESSLAHLPVFGFDPQDFSVPQLLHYLTNLCLKAQVTLIFLQFRHFQF
jgi:hypothetical protein